MQTAKQPQLSWSARMDDDRPLPYLARVWVRRSSGPEYWGTGVLVDSQYVLTCRHVVGAPAAGSLIDEATRPRQAFADVDIQIRIGDQAELAARVAAVHPDYDLALLRLERALGGLWAPLEMRELPSVPCRTWICGFDDRAVGLQFITETREIDPSIRRRGGGRQESIPFDFGPREGFSGGPMFIEEPDGQPAFLGLAQMGGQGTSTGVMIAADAIHGFLKDQGISVETGSVAGPFVRWCRLEGWAPVMRSGRPDLVPNHVGIPASDRLGVCYVAPRPVPARAKTAHPAHPSVGRLAAHLADASEIDELLGRLGSASGLRLRLQTYKEFEHLCEITGGQSDARAASIMGRPTTIGDYGDEDDGILCPPDTSAEWVEGAQGRRYLCLYRDGEMRCFDDSAALAREIFQIRAVVRTVIVQAGGQP